MNMTMTEAIIYLKEKSDEDGIYDEWVAEKLWCQVLIWARSQSCEISKDEADESWQWARQG